MIFDIDLVELEKWIIKFEEDYILEDTRKVRRAIRDYICINCGKEDISSGPPLPGRFRLWMIFPLVPSSTISC